MQINITDVKINNIAIYPREDTYFIDVNYSLLDVDGVEISTKSTKIEKSEVAEFNMDMEKGHIEAFNDSVKEHLLNKEKI